MNDKYSLAESDTHSLGEESKSLDEGAFLVGTYLDREKGLHKPDESSTVGQKTFTIRGNLDRVFVGCLKVLEERVELRGWDSEILEEEGPKFIKALIGGSTITVETRQVRAGMVEVHFQSDSLDSSTDRENVDKFEDLILTELGQ